MSAKPPSTSATGNISMFARVRRALKGDPWSREELHDYIRQPETDLDAEEKSRLRILQHSSITSQLLTASTESDLQRRIRSNSLTA